MEIYIKKGFLLFFGGGEVGVDAVRDHLTEPLRRKVWRGVGGVQSKISQPDFIYGLTLKFFFIPKK